MKKMIDVINDNLRTVLNGIHTHKEDTEKKLDVIVKRIHDKVAVANSYKAEVEKSRLTISSLENEISQLQQDLRDVKSRFEGRNFTAILDAANKEINTKIIEKRSLIDQQAGIIRDLTEKAHALKDELIELKAKKSATEKSVEDANVLLDFYENRILDIVSLSEAHSDNLKDYALTSPVAEDENVNLDTSIDSSVFEEIDEVASSEPTQEVINDVLEGKLDNVTEVESTPEEKLSMTQELDDIISQASAILERSEKEGVPVTELVNEMKEQEVQPQVEEVQPQVEEVQPQEELNSEVVEDAKTETEEVHEDTNNDDEYIDIFVPDDIVVEDTEEKEEKPNIIDINVEDDDIEPIADALKSVEDETLNVIDIDVADDELTSTIGFEDLFKDELPKDEDVKEETKEGEPVEVQEENPEDKFDMELEQAGIDKEKLSTDQIVLLQNNFDVNRAKSYMNILANHSLSDIEFYNHIDVYNSVSPEDMNSILKTLDDTGSSVSAISMVFGMLKNVDANKLEDAYKDGENQDLSDILFDAMEYTGDSGLTDRLELNSEEVSMLKDKTTNDEWKRMQMFSDIVMTNYNTLKNLHINNLKECVSKHPRRFLMNPDRFSEILDKYDTEDLIRCINKNSAVIDKL